MLSIWYQYDMPYQPSQSSNNGVNNFPRSAANKSVVPVKVNFYLKTRGKTQDKHKKQ